MPWVGEKVTPELGAYMNQPPSAAATEEPRRVEHDATEQERPERQRVETGERDVSSADLQRQQVVHERGAERHHHQEDHGGSVHRVHLVVEVGAEELALGGSELQADQDGFDAADQEEEDRGAPYMMPIFLWSTVVTQLRQPVDPVGRAKTPMGRCGGCRQIRGRGVRRWCS
jgi:hypothetical protein